MSYVDCDEAEVAEILVDCIQSIEVVGDCILITYGLTSAAGSQTSVLRVLWRGGQPMGLGSGAETRRRPLRN